MKARIFALPGDAGVISMNLPRSRLVIAETRAWVERVVIGLNLCPFAKAPQVKGQVRYVLSEASEPEALLAGLVDELKLLAGTPADRIETTLLVHPHVLADFADYNDFLGLAEVGCRRARARGRDPGGELSPALPVRGHARRTTSATRPTARRIRRCTCCARRASSARSPRSPRPRRSSRRTSRRCDGSANRVGRDCSSSAATMRTVRHSRSARRTQAAKSRRKRRTISTV